MVCVHSRLNLWKKNTDYIVVDGSKIIYVNEWLSQMDEEGKGLWGIGRIFPTLYDVNKEEKEASFESQMVSMNTWWCYLYHCE